MQEKTGLYLLIKSLTKSEKRHFKLHHGHYGEESEPLYLRLFDTLEKMKRYDEQRLQDSLFPLSTRQIINAKRNLYQLLLRSLRQLHVNHRKDLLISEKIDHARILYSKGLYLDSLKILEKTLPIAIKFESPLLQLEIMEFEKFIEARHITRSRRIENKVEALIDRSELMGKQLSTSVELSNFSLKIHGYYIQNGFVKSQEDIDRVNLYFQNSLSTINLRHLLIGDRIFLVQARMWHRYILQDVKGTYRYARQWVALFDRNLALKLKDPDPYLRGLHYLLLACFYAEDHSRYRSHYRTLAGFVKKYKQEFSVTSQMLAFIYHNNARINRHLLTGDYRKALSYKNGIMAGIQHFYNQIDLHRILIFYYKIAWLHFGRNQFDEALEMLNLIIHQKTSYLRQDLKCYALLLHLICHLRLGHFGLGQYLLRSTKRAFQSTRHESSIILATFTFLQEWMHHPNQLISSAKTFKQKVDLIESDSIDRRSLTYFNFHLWAQSLIEQTSIEKAARKIHLSR